MFRRKGLLLIFAVLLIMSLMVGCGQKKTEEPAKGDSAKSEPAKVEEKNITLIVPNSPGKGMDQYARTIVPFVEKYYPGAKINVKNITGAGGIVGTNQLWHSKPDGLTIAFTSFPTLLLAELSGAEGVQFKTTEFTYLARAAAEPRVLYTGAKSKFKTMEDVVKAGRVIKYPSQGMDEDFFTSAVTAKALGFKLDQITGYEGNADTSLAVIKGEGDIHIVSLQDAIAMEKNGDIRPLLIFGEERTKEYPDVPTALEITEGEAKDFMLILTNMINNQRAFFGPKGMDPEATKAFREAFDKALTDPELTEQANKINRPISYLHGDKLTLKVDEIAQRANKIVDTLKEAVAAIKK